eukprot:symbB.v1.2.004222.t1/scaffold221.1/size262466/6
MQKQQAWFKHRLHLCRARMAMEVLVPNVLSAMALLLSARNVVPGWNAVATAVSLCQERTVVLDVIAPTTVAESARDHIGRCTNSYVKVLWNEKVLMTLTTPLALDASRSPSPIDLTKPQQSRSKSPEGLKSQEILQATLSIDRRTQAAVPPGQLQQPKAFAMVPPQGINEIASRAGSPGPLLYTRPCAVPQQTSPPVQASPLGRVQMRAKPSSAAAPPRITSFPVSGQVIPIGYKCPPPRPMPREMLNLVKL